MSERVRRKEGRYYDAGLHQRPGGKPSKKIEKEEGTDAAIEAGILSDPDALYFQNLEEVEAARVARALKESEESNQSYESQTA